jgi:hypothetical protein
MEINFLTQFFKGVASIFNINGDTFEIPKIKTDAENLRDNWQNIGNGMRKVIQNMKIGDSINIAKDFSDTPNNGEVFYESLLLPKFKKAILENHIILVNLDNLKLLPASFVSQSFMKLAKEYGSEKVLEYIYFQSNKVIRKEKVVEMIKNFA